MAELKAETPVVGTREEYLRIHRFMALTKALDDRMHILVKQGRAPFVGSARGHEGVQVGATAALDGPDDWLVPHYRGLGSVATMGLTAREWMPAVYDRGGVHARDNAGGAVPVPRSEEAGSPDLHRRAAGYGIARIQVGGSAVAAGHAPAREAVARGRAGEGPTLIEGLIKRINS